MTRSAPPTPEALRQARRDPRYRAAQEARATLARSDEQRWRAAGLCLSLDPEVFFPTSGDDPAPALTVCGGCPVRAACLAAALEHGECDGVWGATTAEERRAMRALWSAPAPRRVRA